MKAVLGGQLDIRGEPRATSLHIGANQMSRKGICLVPAETESRDLRGLRCCDGSHAHISNSELLEGRRLKRIESGWLREPGPHTKGVVRRVQEFAFRGLSCRVGGGIAAAVYEQDKIGLVMYAEIKRKRFESEAR